MSNATLYDDDIYAWSQDQARIIRELRDRGLGLPNEFDLEHVAEEIEDLGMEQRYATESNLVQVLIHLIKLAALPGNDASRHWLEEADTFLDNASQRFRPSMRRAIDPEGLWKRARKRAARALEDAGSAVPLLPECLPFTLEEMVSPEADPRVMLETLVAIVDDLERKHKL